MICSPTIWDSPFVNEGTLTAAADTSTTGAKCTYTVPAGVQATLTSATQFETTGTTVVSALRLTRGGTTVNLTSATNAGTWTGNIPLQAGDVVSWVVTTAVALSVTDFSINVLRDRVVPRISLGFRVPAVLDQGITLYQGTLPLMLWGDDFGPGIKEEINAIGSLSGMTIGLLEVFE